MGHTAEGADERERRDDVEEMLRKQNGALPTQNIFFLPGAHSLSLRIPPPLPPFGFQYTNIRAKGAARG